ATIWRTGFWSDVASVLQYRCQEVCKITCTLRIVHEPPHDRPSPLIQKEPVVRQPDTSAKARLMWADIGRGRGPTGTKPIGRAGCAGADGPRSASPGLAGGGVPRHVTLG